MRQDLEITFKAMINSIGDGIYMTDSEGYCIAYNEAFLRITGITNEIMGQHVSKLLMANIISDSVMIYGESGVGKGLIASLIHEYSGRAEKGQFVKVDCAAIPSSLLESELFGYDRGAFTGARREGKPGLLEMANHGTVFLDEIGELPLFMQVKLLNVLQDRPHHWLYDCKLSRWLLSRPLFPEDYFNSFPYLLVFVYNHYRNGWRVNGHDSSANLVWGFRGTAWPVEHKDCL